MSLDLIELSGEVVCKLFVRLLIFLVEIGKLALKLDNLILDHLNAPLVVIFIEDVTGHDEILSAIFTMTLLAVPRDQIAVLGDD